MTYPGTGPNLLEDGAGWEVAPDGIHQRLQTLPVAVKKIIILNGR